MSTKKTDVLMSGLSILEQTRTLSEKHLDARELYWTSMNERRRDLYIKKMDALQEEIGQLIGACPSDVGDILEVARTVCGPYFSKRNKPLYAAYVLFAMAEFAKSLTRQTVMTYGLSEPNRSAA